MSADDGAEASEIAVAEDTPRDKDTQGSSVTAPKRKAESASPAPDDRPSPKRVKAEEGEGVNDDPRQDAATAQAVTVAVEDAASHTSSLARPESHVDSEVYAHRKADSRSRSPADARRPSLSSVDTNRRRDFSQEEKKRGKRLFGGLLSTLSQTTASSQQKRRLEIERRQQDRAQQQRVEDDKRRAERMAKLERVRKIEQVKFDEQVMRTRHSHILARANNLRTTTEPVLYYRPWQLTKAQEEDIRDQVQDAEKVVEKERREFKRRKELRLLELGVTLTPSRPASAVSEAGAARSNHSIVDAAPTPERSTAPDTVVHEKERDHDETGDVMVEAEEDTVIY